jgi:hypothetical protein
LRVLVDGTQLALNPSKGAKKMKKQIKFTTPKNKYHILIFALLTGMILLGFIQTSTAQIIRTKPTPQVRATPPLQVRRTPPLAQKIIVFKGTGTQQQQLPKFERSEKVRAPAALTLSEKQNLFNEALLSNGAAQGSIVEIPYATLNARTIYFENRASIDLVNAAVRTQDNYILFRNKEHETWFELNIKPTKAGQWFMIDCSITPEDNTPGGMILFQIYGLGFIAEKAVYGADHIQMFLLAQNNNWHEISVVAPRGSMWVLHSCEITKND